MYSNDWWCEIEKERKKPKFYNEEFLSAAAQLYPGESQTMEKVIPYPEKIDLWIKPVFKRKITPMKKP